MTGRREEFDPKQYVAKNREFQQRVLEMANAYKVTELPDFLRNFIARVYIKHNLESIRAIEAVQQGAVLYSILKKHKQIMINDVIEMLPLALKHRVDGDTLVKIMNGLESKSSRDSILNIKDRRPSKAAEKGRRRTLTEGRVV